MKTIPDSLTPEQAWERLCDFPRLPAVTKRLPEALDHCLAEDIPATEDVPPADRSFMDGYAVRAADVRQVPARLKLTGEIFMGEFSKTGISNGEAMAIPTGGFLPAGADAVVMQEDTEDTVGSVLIKRSVQPSENVQSKGEDFRKGDALFAARHRLRPQDLGAIGTFGITQVSVCRKPQVGVFSTGNELVSFNTPDAELGKIRETNSLGLSAAAQKFHFPVRTYGIIRDEFEAQRAALEKALETNDAVLVSGGSSVGARDYTLEVIESFPKHKIRFHGLAIRPGNPTIFATIGAKSVFGLPGQPVSSLIVFYLFVLPFLFHLSGDQINYASYLTAFFRTQAARLSTTLKPLRTKTDYVRLRLSCSGDEFLATPVLGKSASLSTLAMADGFIVVPPGEKPVEAGTVINVILFP